MRPWSIKGQRPLSGWRAMLSLRVPWWRVDWPILDTVATASLGVGKTGDGLDAIRWWREGRLLELVVDRALAGRHARRRHAGSAHPTTHAGND